MKTVAFFTRHFSERGVDVSTYDYAHYNETILGNRSIIIGFSKEAAARYTGKGAAYFAIEYADGGYERFVKRFKVYAIEDYAEVNGILEREHVDLYYTQTHGCAYAETWPYGLPTKVKSLVHCVFTTTEPHGNFYMPIGDDLNARFNTSYPVLPLIVNVADTQEDLRAELGIPRDAIVFGRYGGQWTFDIPFAQSVVRDMAIVSPNHYFVFMNTQRFCELPNVFFLDMSVDLVQKRKFINTCDAMLHARLGGETFGLSVAEFAVCEKPIFSFGLSAERQHIKLLEDKIQLYYSEQDLMRMLSEFKPGMYDMRNNGYMKYLPQNVMPIFEKILYSLPTDSTEYDILKRAVEMSLPVPGMTCEIGVREGGGTHIILEILREAGQKKTHIAIDPFGNIEYTHHEDIVDRPGYTNAMRNKMLAGLYAYVQRYDMDCLFFPLEDTEFFTRFADGVPTYNNNKQIQTHYSFVFLDGPHSVDAVRIEFDFFKTRMPVGGVIVFDDTYQYPHMEKLDPYICENGYERIEKGFNKISYRKTQ